MRWVTGLLVAVIAICAVADIVNTAALGQMQAALAGHARHDATAQPGAGLQAGREGRVHPRHAEEAQARRVIPAAIIGASRPEQVTENAEAAGVRLDDAVLTRIDDQSA